MIFTKLKKNTGNKLLSVLFLSLGGLFFAQNYPTKLGIKAGWNFSNINAVDEKGDPSGYISNGGELFGGFAIEKQISAKSYLQANVLVSYSDAITFLELPVYYKYNFYKKISVLAGPKINYIPDSEASQPYYFKRRFGISGDIGIEYTLSKHFNIDAVFSKGFTKQYDDLILTYYNARRDVYRLGVTFYF